VPLPFHVDYSVLAGLQQPQFSPAPVVSLPASFFVIRVHLLHNFQVQEAEYGKASAPKEARLFSFLSSTFGAA
jgi:hypothetical protein